MNEIDSQITTIKLSKKTKERLLKLKVYKNETFEEILEKMLNLLNLCKQNPDRAKQTLNSFEVQRKINLGA